MTGKGWKADVRNGSRIDGVAVNKSKRIVVVLLVAIGLLTPVCGLFFVDRIVPVLGPILFRPDGVPDHASATFNSKEGSIVWRWGRTLSHGCAKWRAMGSWATVTLARSHQGCTGKGSSLKYTSFAEEVVFDWGRGDWSGGNPCPFSVPSQEIAAYLRLAGEARDAANTDPERAMLMQIEQRLAKVDGDKLRTDHSGGCSDDYTGPSRPHLDVWNPH